MYSNSIQWLIKKSDDNCYSLIFRNLVIYAPKNVFSIDPDHELSPFQHQAHQVNGEFLYELDPRNKLHGHLHRSMKIIYDPKVFENIFCRMRPIWSYPQRIRSRHCREESHPFPLPFIPLSLTQHTQNRRGELLPNNIPYQSKSQWSFADLQRSSVKKCCHSGRHCAEVC